MKRITITLALLAAVPAWAAETKFRIPSQAQASFGHQAEVDPGDIEILVAGVAGTGVVSGVSIQAQGSPDMTLAVASGSVRVGTTIASVSSGNVTITTAHATLPRFDLVVVNSSGTKSVTAGTAATDPVFPTIPASSVVIAAVYVPAADTSIQDNQIVGKQVILSSYSGFSLTAGRVAFAGAGGALTDDADMTFATDTLTVSKITAPGGGAPSERFGGGAIASGDSSLAVGPSATTGSTLQSTAVGASASASSANSATAVGKSATASGITSVAVGASASASGSSGTAVGSSASANAACTAIGGGANCAGLADAVVLGLASSASTIYPGGSPYGTTLQTYSGQEADGVSSNQAGGSVRLRPGRSSGTATAGNAEIMRVPTTQGSGATYNSLISGMLVVSKARTLTDATATTLFVVGGLGAHKRVGGTVFFTVQAGDGTNDQAATGMIRWACVDTTAGAGGETCSVTEHDVGSASPVGSLACTAEGSTGTDVGNIRLNCDTSLTSTVLNVYYTAVTNCETCTITPQ